MYTITLKSAMFCSVNNSSYEAGYFFAFDNTYKIAVKNDDGEGSESVTIKNEFMFFKLFRVYSKAPWNCILGDRTQVRRPMFTGVYVLQTTLHNEISCLCRAETAKKCTKKA